MCLGWESMNLLVVNVMLGKVVFFVDFVKMGQKRRIMILMIFNKLMKLLGWLKMIRNSILNQKFWVWNHMGENFVFELKVDLRTFEKQVIFGELD